MRPRRCRRHSATSVADPAIKSKAGNSHSKAVFAPNRGLSKTKSP
jgi:hypothetical protein